MRRHETETGRLQLANERRPRAGRLGGGIPPGVRSGEPLQNSPRASCCRTRMASPTGKRPLENETDTDTLYPATRPVQENDDESDANDAESPESHRGFGRKMARLLCSQVGCESLAAMGGLCKRHNPGRCEIAFFIAGLFTNSMSPFRASSRVSLHNTRLQLGRVYKETLQKSRR